MRYREVKFLAQTTQIREDTFQYLSYYSTQGVTVIITQKLNIQTEKGKLMKRRNFKSANQGRKLCEQICP